MEKREVVEAIEILRKFNTENDKIEAKTAAYGFPKKCYDTFSSFSNKSGGIIIFGLSENNGFKTEGVYDVKKLQQQITNLCSDSMEPVIRPEILSMDFEGKNIVAVKVEEILENKKPCYYKPMGIKNGSYTRIGDRDDKMTDYELYSFQSYSEHIFEDTRLNKRAKLDDLNIKGLKRYIDKVKNDKPHFSKNNFKKCLKLCGIIDVNKKETFPTIAGTLIFCDYPQSFYPQLFVACVVIPGNELGDVGDYGERFIDNKRVEGTIEEMLEGTMNFLRRNMKTSIIIDTNGKRLNRTEYPIEALREAVANALIHRDYSTQTENAYISVNMYNDRIEIINPGNLYGTNKLEKLGTATTMEARNPTIVRILEENDSVIENRHSGIPTMKREMRKYGLPEPEFYEERDSFKVVFRKQEQGDTQNEISDTQNEVSDTQMSKTTGAQMSKTTGAQIGEITGAQMSKITGAQMGKITGAQMGEITGAQTSKTTGAQNILYVSIIELQQVVLDYCKNPKSSKEIREYIGLSSKTYVAESIIKPLLKEGKLEYTNKNSKNARNQKYKTKRKLK